MWHPVIILEVNMVVMVTYILGCVLHLEFDHPAVQHVFVRGGSAVGLQHVTGISHPVLQLFQALREQLVLGHNAVDSRCFFLSDRHNIIG